MKIKREQMMSSKTIFFIIPFFILSCQKRSDEKREKEVVKSSYENGMLEMAATRLNGVNDGKVYMFTDEGYKFAELNYDKGSLEGESLYYSEGHLVRIENYKNNNLDGVFKVFDKDGRIVEEGNYLENKKNGIWNLYHNNKLVLSENYADSVVTIFKEKEYYNDPKRLIPSFKSETEKPRD